MRIGYKPVKRKLITGASVLNKIKYDQLRIIGAGANGIVLTDGKYAIKVGNLHDGDYENLNEAASYGFAVPVVYYERSIKIDPRIVDILRNQPAYRNGSEVDIEEYLSDNDRADMMISLLAKPYLDNNCYLSHDSDGRDRAYRVAYNVRDKYAEVSDNNWSDVHPWNLGIYKGALIILDF